jgi:hypothetical protein
MCRCTSRLKGGRPPDAEGLGRSRAGILVGSFSGPREGVACAGRQSLGQWERDISACGEKSSPSPWSSPRGEEMPSADSGLTVDPIRRSIDGVRPRDCRSSNPQPNAIPSPGGEGQDEGELPAPKAVTSLSRGGSPGQIESNLVQANDFHRRDAETRRDCEVGKARGSGWWCPVPVAGAAPIFAAWRLGVKKVRSSALTGASPTWSKQNFFSGLSGAGHEPPPGPGGMRDRRECRPTFFGQNRSRFDP